MMALVSVPPFESFYEEHRDAVFRELRRQLGKDAEDAYQETFLRALRAYGRLKHADNLRAWVLTIARRVAADHYRRREAPPIVVEPETDSRPAYAELGDLADGLPRKERAAVVLRYGYDMSYAAIGAALGSSEDAARQAASSGVRRLRRRLGGADQQRQGSGSPAPADNHMTPSDHLSQVKEHRAETRRMQ
jgi:RNA polymerase sigma-70 factor (ECF subfamily)